MVEHALQVLALLAHELEVRIAQLILAAALQRGLKATADGIPAVINVITDSHARSSTYMGFFGEAGEYS